MGGIDILNCEEIMITPTWVTVAIWILLFIMVVSIVFVFTIITYGLSPIVLIIDLSLFILSIIGCIILGFGFCESSPSGRYRYEVTIDESVSIQYIYDNYDVVEQRGDIWVLEDKEGE